jgi:SPW repeat
MELRDLLKPHRSWEDGLGLLLGLTIALTPWLYDEYPVLRVGVNSAVTGLAVLMLAQLEMLRRRRWEEFAQLACGVWLIISPFIFEYAYQDHLRFWHWALGGSVPALAAFELWQDWDVVS